MWFVEYRMPNGRKRVARHDHWRKAFRHADHLRRAGFMIEFVGQC